MDKIGLMLEAEKRGILPPEKVELLAEARRRGLVLNDIQKLRGTPVAQGMPTNVSQLQDPSAAVRSIAEVLPAIGAIGGSSLGAFSPIPGSTAIGGALGYTGMKNLKRTILGEPVNIDTAVQDVNEGMIQELGGKAISTAAKLTGKAIGGVAKQFLGKTTGAGPGAIEEAVKAGEAETPVKNLFNKVVGRPVEQTAFTKAMRGAIPKEQVVGDALEALKQVKDLRSNAYRSELAKLSKDKTNIDITPIQDKLKKLLSQYNIKITNDGLDFSRSAIDRQARNSVKEIVDDVSGWGTQADDLTPLGLDTLKRRLDDFYTDSSNAGAFVTAIRNSVKDTITQSVPKYAIMTGEYASATKQIRELEKSLMLGKDKTADQILRRLTSSMRENFDMRREMVDILGSKGGKDLAGEVAGYAMNQPLPKGLVGPLAMGGAGVASYINPSFLPLLATASPRTVGEFLKVFGSASREVKAVAPYIRRGIAAYGTEKFMENEGGK